LKVKTVTEHHYADPNGMATDPPVSEAQRGAMGAAAGGNSTLGIPQSVGKEFMNADPGGKLQQKAKDGAYYTRTAIGERQEKPAIDDQNGRFSLSPDGQYVIDNQTGNQHSIDDVMRILFSDGQNDSAASLKPEVTVAKDPVSKPMTPTGMWKSPKIDPSTRSGNPGDNGKPPLGNGEGGTALGNLLKYTAGETSRDDTMKGGSMGYQGNGWSSPTIPPQKAKDGGPGSGPQKGRQRSLPKELPSGELNTSPYKGLPDPKSSNEAAKAAMKANMQKYQSSVTNRKPTRDGIGASIVKGATTAVNKANTVSQGGPVFGDGGPGSGPHPGGGSEGGETVKSTSGKSTVTKVEPTAKGAVYHVDSSEHGGLMKNQLHYTSGGNLYQHVSNGSPIANKISLKFNPDIHDAVKNHIKQHGLPKSVKGGTGSIVQAQPGSSSVGANIKRNMAAQAGKRRAGF
jgi:hypothetical protein